MEAKVSIIVLSYNGKENAKECIESVRKIDYKNYEIVIVDNASSDGSVEYLKNKFPDIKIIPNGKNLGYAGGNNVGICYALERGCDFILLLNDDVVVSENFLSCLIKGIGARQDVAVIGPKIYYYNSKRINFAGGFLDKNYTPIIKGYGQNDTGEFDRPQEVDYISGACFLVKADAFKEIGPLDEDYFLLWEETDFCLRAKKRNYKIFFEPNSIIWHKESAAFNGNESALYSYYYLRNKLLFLKKNVKNAGILITATALNGIITALRLIKKYKYPDGVRKAKIYFCAIVDFYLKKYGKGPEWLDA